MPAFSLCGEATDQRPQNGSANSGNAPNPNTLRTLRGFVHVCYTRTTIRQNWGADEASEETEGQEHAEVACQGSRNLEGDEDKQCANLHWNPADLKHLAHWSPDHWPETITSHEECQAKRCRDLADVDIHHDALDTGAVDGAANLDGEGEETHFKGDKDFPEKRPIHRVLRIVVPKPFDNIDVSTIFTATFCPIVLVVRTMCKRVGDVFCEDGWDSLGLSSSELEVSPQGWPCCAI